MSSEINNLRGFGKFRLDAGKKLLWYEEEQVSLTLKDIEVLCVLTETGEMVTKEDLMNRVWPDSFVEESNLSKHIYRLRKTLAKYGDSQDPIETVPKRGYRWKGEIRHLSNGRVHEAEGVIQKAEDSDAKILPYQPSKYRYLIPVAAAIFLFSLLLAGFIFTRQTKPADSIRSIAVLPLKNQGSNSLDESLSIRITDAIITRLGGSNKIIVRPTSAVIPFAKEEQDVLETGKKLQVETVLDGRIQEENGKLRVTLQLINVADGRQLWAGQIDGASYQILSLQDEISHKVLQNLDPDYKRETELTTLPTKNAQAYEAYLQGRFYTSKRTLESLNKAIGYFQRSVELDPEFAEGYAGLADANFLLFDNSLDTDIKRIETAKANVQKALSLRPGMADALVTLGHTQANADWDWQSAEATYLKAIAIAPNNSTARLRYGILLNRLAKFDEAHKQIGKAIELDPTALMNNVHYGVTYYYKKDYEAAIEQYRKVAEANPKFGPIHWWLSRSLWLAGRKDEAVKEILLGMELEGDTGGAKRLREVSETASPEDFLRALIKEWEANPANTNEVALANKYANLGEKEKALDYLEKAYEKRHPWTTQIKATPEFNVLKDEPGYQELLRKMNLQ